MKAVEEIEVRIDFGTAAGPIRQVGRLLALADKMAFQFDRSFLESPLGLSPYDLKPLSRVQTKPRGQLWGVFEDSLPDTWGRKLIIRELARIGMQSPGPLDLLSAVGTRALGALTYHPMIDSSVIEPKPLELGLLAHDAEALYRGEPAKVLDVLTRAGGSPGGARPKVLVGITPDGRIWPDVGPLPPDATRWLIKFHGNDSPESGVIEAALSRIARTAGIPVPTIRLLVAESGARYVASERFDRTADRRWHVHTFGGLVGTGGYEVHDYSELLGAAHFLTRDIAAVRDMARRMIFNVAVGNRDDHEKNSAFIMDMDGSWRPSPAYDLTWSDGSVRGEHTVMVAGKGRDISMADCAAVGAAAGLQRPELDRLRDEVLSAVNQWSEVAGELGLDERMATRIQGDIQTNTRRLRS